MDREYQQRQRVLNSYRAFLSQKLEPALQKAHEERRKVEEKTIEKPVTKDEEDVYKTNTNVLRGVSSFIYGCMLLIFVIERRHFEES